MATNRQHRRGLVHELQRSHLFVIWVLGGMLLLSLVSSGFLIATQSRLERDIATVRTARDAREAMVDQETGLRGWLATGDRVFLEPFDAGRTVADRAFAQLGRDVASTPELTRYVVDLLVARERWDAWAAEAVGRQGGAENGGLGVFLLRGKTIFDQYRRADETSTTALQARRERTLRHQTIALSVTAAGYLVVLTGAGAVTLRRRRRLRSAVVEPIDRLLATIGALRAGDLGARTTASGVPELDQIGAEVDRLARELGQAEVEATRREARLSLLAERFEAVVTVGREVSGSLSVRYVSRAVTTAAADFLGTPATLWVRDSNQRLVAADRSQDPHGVVPPPGLVPPVAVTTAAAEARQVDAAGRLAHPLVLAGMVVGVLDCSSASIDEDTELVLTALLATAAAALESAHLHSAARELADVDGLTHLANRRRFELDVDDEWERCRRYGRPMSIVMLDLDHFKRFNDEHGHLLGDAVLREAAAAIDAETRTTDTAYRYGGEEIVLLLRETGLEDAVTFAERLRAAVAAVHIADYQVTVTTSAGVAARRTSMSHYTELLAAADRALYAAKAAGRNRVVADVDPALEPALAPEPALALEPTPARPAG